MSQPTVFKPEEYIRRPFIVQAVEVSEENMAQVAAWCGGEVRTSDESKDGEEPNLQKYIKVNVKRPLNERQTKAYFGDWVLSAGSGFKVYTPKAFTTSFEKRVQEMLDTVERMEQRVAREDREEAEQDGVPSDTYVSPGI
jgi:glutamine amidotransferase PdxT